LKEKLGLYTTNHTEETGFDWSNHKEFNGKLSLRYITEISNQNPQTSLDLSDSNFTKVCLFLGKENVFFSELDKVIPSESIGLASVTDPNWEKLNDYSSFLVAVFVPSAKPVNHFGMNMDMIEKLMAKIENKNCQLYLFGSPLSLNKIRFHQKFSKVICAFQDFQSSQKAAALHFLGKIEAEGRLD
jgi:hypothetical protein